MIFTKTGWKIRVFCQDVCVIYDAKGREICTTPSKEIAEYLVKLNEERKDKK